MQIKVTRERKVAKISLRQITVAGMLAAISIVLSTSVLGYIPLGIANATTMHIPAIIGGVLEGPIVGAFIGLIFGLTSFIRQNTPLFADPVIAILPRVFIGVVAHYFYKLTKNVGIAAAGGTLTNTIGVLGLAVLLKYLPFKVALFVALKNGVFEIIVAVILTTIIVKPLKKMHGK
ncbi:membrane protein-like protein [Thermoanaerobacter mathranii subsp. mathranii str. A3]|uniref:Membrane protein-like protein n=1 Tax=Thermoanaerobacter mathranii subsp. mathranii (strain DSM 11426 / CCUG 53645 / CIP 108742 / A3) TaxID=583358 RepID=A0ABN3Z849_THEM3|nr:ECF transporter S component [Thermoanaerobacter mathranii]ADH61689.1 membrane protein-like protein [Thermoanaerobacter mathranii subsp. mathranii str. A3]